MYLSGNPWYSIPPYSSLNDGAVRSREQSGGANRGLAHAELAGPCLLRALGGRVAQIRWARVTWRVRDSSDEHGVIELT